MRMHTKRLLAVLLVMVMVFTMIPVSNAAGETAPLRLNVVTSGRSVGDTLKVTVEATEADAIADGKLSISYNSNVLKYQSAEAGAAWAADAELSLQVNSKTDKVIAAFAADAFAAEGEILVLYFEAIAEGTAELELVEESYISGYDNVVGEFSLVIRSNDDEHTFGEWIEVIPATCTTNGVEERVCEDCDLVESRLTAVLGHNYSEEVTAPTCTAIGYTTYTCETCGHEYVANIQQATGHDYESVVTAPTHDKMGYTTHTCKDCDHSYVDSYTDALEHEYTSTVTKEATCTEEGTMTFTCQCGETYTEVIPVVPHEYEPVLTEPTCTTMGYTTYTCDCGHSYKGNYVDAEGHNCTVETVSATCTEAGYTIEKCQKCDFVNIVGITQPTGHTWGQWTVEKAPTCTEMGMNKRVCSDCQSVEVETVAALGHDYDKKVTAPTCTEVGYTTYTCDCGHSYVADIVEALGHDYESVVTNPTHDKMGYTTHTCKVCDHSYVDSYTAALDHEYTREVTKAPTCTEEGVMTFTCDCGKSYTEAIPMIAHTYASVVTAPTCTDMGYTTHTCEACGHSYVDSFVAALGHEYETTVVEATCVEFGYTSNKCTVCEHTYISEITQPTGHTVEVINERPATCMEEGYTGDKVCAVCGENLAEGQVLPIDMNTCPSIGFKDVNQKQWYHKGIDYVVTHGIMNGMSEDVFSPNGILTRGQLVTMLYRMAGEPEFTAENPFTDVAEDKYYADAVVWAYENGVVKGISETLFAPELSANREQVATFMHRYAKLLGLSVEHEGTLEAYPDAATVSEYAVEAMTWAVGTGIINGIDGSLMPRDTATRAQIATMIMRFETSYEN